MRIVYRILEFIKWVLEVYCILEVIEWVLDMLSTDSHNN